MLELDLRLDFLEDVLEIFDLRAESSFGLVRFFDAGDRDFFGTRGGAVVDFGAVDLFELQVIK